MAGLIASVSLAVPEAHAELKHRYQFNDSPGSTTVADSIGGANGTLINTTGNAAFDGDRLTLGNDGSQGSNGNGAAPPTPITYEGDFVDLPNGLLTDLNTGAGQTQFTFEAWFTRTGNGTWMRVWDFGTSGNGEDYSNSGANVAQTFVSAQSGVGSVRAAWRPDGAADENPVLDRPGVAPLNELTHVAFVWDETATTARFYVNGAPAGGSASVPTTLAEAFFDNGTPLDVNNWLGRAQWDDPLFVGSFEEFRIWDEALSGATVLNNFLNGPEDPFQEGPGSGELTGIEATTNGEDVIISATTQINVEATYENATIPVTTGLRTTYTSGNTAVATVNAVGVVTGVAPGTAEITVDFEGFSDSVSVTVIIPDRPPAVLAHRYQFNEADGATTVEDSAGDADGEARDVAFNGTEAVLTPGNFSHINLPNGIISAKDNVTIETWVTITGTGGAWQRVYDFGTTTLGEDPSPAAEDPDYFGDGGSSYLFYAPRRGGIGNADGGRFTFRNGTAEVASVDPSLEGGLVANEKGHLVTIFNYAQRQTQVWLDGALVGQNSIPTGSSLDILDDVNNWIGRSQYKPDAFLSGSIDEFRIYEGVMSPLEIAASGAAGPDVSELIGDPGDPVSFAISAESNTAVENGAPVPVSLTADFSTIAGVNITGVPGASLSSSNTDVVQVFENPYRIVPVGAGTAQITGAFDGQDATPLNFTVTTDDRPLALEHRYTFDGNAEDVVGTLDGRLWNTNGTPDSGGVYEDGGLTLAGAGFVDLPNFIFSDYFYQGDAGNLPAVTLEVFGSRAAGGNWQRIFSFGTNEDQIEDPTIGTEYFGANLVFLTPLADTGTVRFSGNDGTAEFAQLNGPALGANQDFHVVVVFDPNVGSVRLYRNGQLAAVSTLPDSIRDALVAGTAVFDNNAWLGRSQYWPDPFFQGRFEEFRIWRGAMSESRVAQNFACGPDSPDGCSLPGPTPTIEPGMNGDAITLSWPESALGFGLESTTTIGDSESWAPVGAQPLTTEGTRTTTVTPAEPTFFRLKADN